MINYFLAILAGIIQGLAEFLPISSSGHLVLFHDLLNFDLPDNLAFDVVLHLGTLVALVLFFFNDLWKYFTAWLQSLINWNLKNDQNQRLAWYLFLATLPAAIAGYFLEDQIESIFRQPSLVALMLIIFGIVLYGADRYFKQEKAIEHLNAKNSLIIGVAQIIALVPGVSRSGITIIAGLSQKLKRDQAARFSFLLSAPIVFGAGFKKLIDLFSTNEIIGSDFLLLSVGFISAAVTGYLCIKYFLKFLQSHSLNIFVYYRLILGVIILLILLIK